MKISVLAAFAAVTCCAALNLCSAQTSEPGVDSGANGSSTPIPFSIEPVTDTENTLNVPTGLFASEGDATEQSPPLAQPPATIVNEAPSISSPFENSPPAQVETPTSEASSGDSSSSSLEQPFGKHQRQQAGERSMVNTILQYGAYQDLPNASYMPIQWPSTSSHSHTTNPIGRYMLRNWCVDGLWATYPAQRAAQCQAIQNSLSGCSHNHCNRYLMPNCSQGCSAHTAAACGPISNGGNGTYSTCANGNAPSIPAVPMPTGGEEIVPVAPVSVHIPTPAAPVDSQRDSNGSTSAPNVVAQQPSYFLLPQIR